MDSEQLDGKQYALCSLVCKQDYSESIIDNRVVVLIWSKHAA